MNWRMLFLYLILTPVCLLICAMLWHLQTANTYFSCKHSGIILDFFPPFVHPGKDGDFFIKPTSAVYAVWSVYIAVGLILPGILVWIGSRVYERDLKKSWM